MAFMFKFFSIAWMPALSSSRMVISESSMNVPLLLSDPGDETSTTRGISLGLGLEPTGLMGVRGGGVELEVSGPLGTSEDLSE